MQPAAWPGGGTSGPPRLFFTRFGGRHATPASSYRAVPAPLRAAIRQPGGARPRPRARRVRGHAGHAVAPPRQPRRRRRARRADGPLSTPLPLTSPVAERTRAALHARVAVLGPGGYTGGEFARLALAHPGLTLDTLVVRDGGLLARGRVEE